MGFPCEMNYILRLRARQGLREKKLKAGAVFPFRKDGARIYPIDAPIDLANERWEIVARVIVTSVTVRSGRTNGTFKVLMTYDKNTRNVLTKVIAEGERLNKRGRKTSLKTG
jgi:hypothetical protein